MTLIVSIRFILLGIVTLLIVMTARRARQSSEFKKGIEYLPEFSFTTVAGDSFSSSDILKGPLLIVQFDPDCEHCDYEITSLLKSSLPQMDCKTLLVTSAERFSVDVFIKRHQLQGFPSFKVLLDSSFQFNERFGTHILPSNFIYDCDLMLVKQLEGEYKSETIIKYLKQID